MSTTTNQYKALDKQYIWHPFTQMQEFTEEENLVIERGEGHYLFDTDGNKYFDGYSSLWVNIHGHNHPALNAAIKEQLEKVSHSTLLGSSNIPSILLAEKLINNSPEKLQKVFYSDDGSTSVEVALKMAYQYWCIKEGNHKRNKFITLSNAYHGDTIGSVSLGAIDIFHAKFRNLLFETVNITSPYCYRCPWNKNKENCSMECIADAVKIINKHAHECAALVMEPMVQGAAGMITQPKGYLKKLEEACRKNDILLILDEVATGFGRTGKLFACEHEGVQPDIMTIAKGISGGYLPIAATLTSQEIYDMFLGNYEELKTFFHGHSFTGNQLGCAVGNVSFDLLLENNFIKKVEKKAALLKQN
ncbi:MAG: adenosylmethionine--8-amino-7-oxononanoate transaminase [Nitrospinae bacterium]|nr:adenosylmethionine--8-amino-7-oxononanoate transaminase [Nitrospinota bacterium]